MVPYQKNASFIQAHVLMGVPAAFAPAAVITALLLLHFMICHSKKVHKGLLKKRRTHCGPSCCSRFISVVVILWQLLFYPKQKSPSHTLVATWKQCSVFFLQALLQVPILQALSLTIFYCCVCLCLCCILYILLLVPRAASRILH